MGPQTHQSFYRQVVQRPKIFTIIILPDLFMVFYAISFIYYKIKKEKKIVNKLPLLFPDLNCDLWSLNLRSISFLSAVMGVNNRMCFMCYNFQTHYRNNMHTVPDSLTDTAHPSGHLTRGIHVVRLHILCKSLLRSEIQFDHCLS